MNGIDVARKVSSEHSAMLYRARKDGAGYDVKPLYCGTDGERPQGGGRSRGWILLDGFSASAIVAVYEVMNEAQRARYTALSILSMARVAFKVCK